MFAEIMTNPKSAGFLLLDEINLSAPLVQSSAYKVVYDRIIGEYCINGNWGIFGAGNLAEDNCFTHEVSPALKDRGGEVELQIPTIEDLTEYALLKKIEGRVIGFLNFKSSNIFKVVYDDAQKDTTPRGWFRVGEMIKGVENLDDVLDIASSNISEGIAVEFVTWLKLQSKVNMREIIKNPEKIKEFDKDKKDGLGMKYFVITALADWYRDDKAKFEDIIKITEVFDEIHSPEFVSLLWRLCLSYKPEFEKEFLKGDVIKLASKYLQYLR
jgi:predicted nucleic-acid-binding protein